MAATEAGWCSDCDEHFDNIAKFRSHLVTTDSRKRDLGRRDQKCFDAFAFFIPAEDTANTEDERNEDRLEEEEEEEEDTTRVRVCVTV